MAKQYKSRPSSFLLMGAICLFAFFIEFLLLECEQLIYAKHYYEFTITESIMHWILICVLWGLISLVMCYAAVRMFSFNLSRRKTLPKKRGYAAAAIIILAAVLLKLYIYSGWKPHIDFIKSGWFQFIFQYIYYLFETFLISITLALFQEGGERIFNRTYIPYGGLILAATWGISHIITQGSFLIGLCYILLAVMFGFAYLYMNKNLSLTYIAVAIMFLL